LDFPITVFGGLQDQTVSYADLLRWKEQTRSIFSLQMVGGNHFFIHSAQDILLKTITEKLNVKM
jgi:medium-chain acyl-[acyl-carrier-protein] hydrolase